MDRYFKDVLDHFKLFVLPLPILESLSFRVHHTLDVISYKKLPGELVC